LQQQQQEEKVFKTKDGKSLPPDPSAVEVPVLRGKTVIGIDRRDLAAVTEVMKSEGPLYLLIDESRLAEVLRVAKHPVNVIPKTNEVDVKVILWVGGFFFCYSFLTVIAAD